MIREARGHRYAGGRPAHLTVLGEREDKRHWVAAIVAAVVAAASTAYAAHQNAQMNEYTAEVYERQRDAAAQAAKMAEDNQREQDARVLAAQRARAAGAGIDEDYGSSLLTQMESRATAELNARKIRWQGQTQAGGFEAERMLSAWQAGATRRSGYVNAGASLLAGGARAYGAYGGGGSGTYDYSRGYGYSSGDNR